MIAQRKTLKRMKTAAFCLVLLCLFCFFPLRIRAAETGSRTVKAGYYYDSDYFFKDEDGNYCGYDAEYYYEISKYTKWQYQYVDYASFEEAYEALKNGDIDILPSLFYTKERAETLLLSDYDMGSVYVTIIVPHSDTSTAYNDYAALKGKKVGILADSVDGEKYREWAEKENLKTDIVELPSTEELLNALDTGKLDAVAISYLGSSSTYRIVKEFSPMDMYFGMPKNDTALMEQLNDALGEIAIQTPEFYSDLYDKYYIANQQQAPAFSNEEKEYIASAGTLSVALLKDSAPFSYVRKDGSMTGALVDYFGKISDLSGLRFTFRACSSEDDVVRAMEDGSVDIGGIMVYNAAEATDRNVLLTNSYLKMALTQVTRKGTAKIRSLAVPSMLYQADKNSLTGLYDTVYTYPTMGGCVEALKRGRADAAVLNTYSANYFMNNNRTDAYNVIALNGITNRLSAGVSRSADSRLLSILNRCIRYSNTTTMNEMIINYSHANSSSFYALLNRIPVLWLFIAVVFMCCFVIVLGILILNFARQQKEKFALAAQRQAVAEREKHLSVVEKTTQEKNEFFSNISHDMRTPLNAIMGFSRLSEQETDPAKMREYNGKIQSAGQLLLDLINDTLTISKANSGKLELTPAPVNSREILKSVVLMIREESGKKGISFTVDDSAGLDRTIYADRLGVQKILLNLLTNAIKYTPEGGHISLRVCNDFSGADGPDTLFVVQDDGIGISPEFIPRIFEPFSQEKRPGYEAAGTGLGLSIVKRLVDLMGGTIHVESKKGEGSTFTVRLHFKEAEVNGEKDRTEPSRETADLGGKRILLCEDNPMNREIAVTILEDRGMQVTTAENGEAGVRYFSESREGTFDLILMDLRMPVMDGFRAAAEIRALKRTDAGTIPILAMSADAFDEDVQRCLDAGMNGHIAKPFSPEKLCRMIAKEIEESGTKQPEQM